MQHPVAIHPNIPEIPEIPESAENPGKSPLTTSSSTSPKSTTFESSFWLSNEQMNQMGIPKHDQARFRGAYYQKCFSIDHWYNKIDPKLTFSTVYLELEQETAIVIKDASLAKMKNGPGWKPSNIHSPIIKQSAGKPALLNWDYLGLKNFDLKHKAQIQSFIDSIDKLFQKNKFNSNGCFFKLSTRSPKDVVVYDDSNQDIYDIVSKEIQSVLPLKDSLMKNHILADSIIRATNETMKVTCGAQVVYFMIASERIFSDINRNLGHASGHWDLKCVFREWKQEVVESPAYEFRCFVYKRKLNAISQYFSFVHYPELVSNQKKVLELITKTFEKYVKSQLDHESYVIDFFAKPKTKDSEQDIIYVIELNPFHNLAGACLFKWSNDRELFMNGPLEFRVLETPDPKEDPLEMLPKHWIQLVETKLSENSKCGVF